MKLKQEQMIREYELETEKGQRIEKKIQDIIWEQEQNFKKLEMAVPTKLPEGASRVAQNQLNELQKKYTEDPKEQKARQKEEEELQKKRKKTTVVLQPERWESREGQRKPRMTLEERKLASRTKLSIDKKSSALSRQTASQNMSQAGTPERKSGSRSRRSSSKKSRSPGPVDGDGPGTVQHRKSQSLI